VSKRTAVTTMSTSMAYAAMMVHIDAERPSKPRIALAVELARRFGAALIGVTGWSPGLGFGVSGALIEADPVMRQAQEMTAHIEAAEKDFRAAATHVSHVEWRGQVGLPIDVVVRESRAADLVIVARERASGGFLVQLDVGGTILRLGRPVLAVPNGIDSLQARRIVVAWKDVREARRAVRDALPFLQEADDVLIAEVSEQGEEAEAQKRLDDVIKYLRGHKVTVGAKVYLRTKSTIASELLRFAGDEKADLLVAGAYGHSRLGEWAFGGVTRELLAGSAICCLLSH
jgi:nucleotide-binding universal stress UspA family protein